MYVLYHTFETTECRHFFASEKNTLRLTYPYIFNENYITVFQYKAKKEKKITFFYVHVDSAKIFERVV